MTMYIQERDKNQTTINIINYYDFWRFRGRTSLFGLTIHSNVRREVWVIKSGA